MCVQVNMHLCYVTSVMSNSVTPWTVDYQTPLSVGFSRQEYWSGLPCPPPGDLPNPGIEPTSLMSPSLAGGFFTASTTWEALIAIPKLLLVVGRGETNFIGENVSQSTLVAVIKYHRLSGLNNKNVFSHSSRGWKSEIRVPVW